VIPLPPPISADIGGFLHELDSGGWLVQSATYDEESFGNYVVEVRHLKKWFDIVRDRGQYFVSGPSMEALRPFGLARAYDDQQAFAQAVRGWLFPAEA
jgi:hypothetical protein